MQQTNINNKSITGSSHVEDHDLILGEDLSLNIIETSSFALQILKYAY